MNRSILSFFLIMYFVSVFLLIRCNNLSTPTKVTKKNIRKIKLNMEIEEVKKILGQPSKIEVKKSYEYYSTGKVIKSKKPTLIFSYSIQNLKVVWYPMLWIHFEKKRVKEVYAKMYQLFDDIGIYGLSKCTYILCKKKFFKWESKLFEKIFP